MNRSGTTRVVFAIALVSLLTGAFFAGYDRGVMRMSELEKANTLNNKELSQPSNVDFSPFWRAWNVLNEKYVATHQATNASSTASLTDQERVWGAIRGMTASLNDPYTVFFDPEENEIFHSAITGSFDGVGMEIAIKETVITVVSPLKDSPAFKAGIKSGDQVIKIDDTPTVGFTVEKAVKMIRGKKGTEVRLLLKRESRPESFEIKVIRETIKVPALDIEGKDSSGATVSKGEDGKPIDLNADGVFIIRLYSFSEDSGTLFQKALRKFADSGSHKLILDLRGNPGGYLQSAVDMASWFLPNGTVVVKEEVGVNKTGNEFRSNGSGTGKFGIFPDGFRMIILVDGGSASASEILAGALSEHGVAKLVGVKTFGKGSVQELVDITPQTALKVTIARWLTPKGISISQSGIQPDFEVKVTEEDIKNKIDAQLNKALELLKKEL